MRKSILTSGGLAAICALSAMHANVARADELTPIPYAQASREWRELSREYQRQIDDLQQKRKERGDSAQSVREKLDSKNWSKVYEQAEKDMQEGLDGIADSIPDAARDYFKGPGKPENVLEAGATILTETLPALDQALTGLYAPVNYEFEVQDLQSDLNKYEREIREFDKKIKETEENMRLSDRVADVYDQELSTTHQKTKEIVFRLVESSKATTQVAQQKHDTIPVGWSECSCPGAHSNVGRVINGKRYHGPGYNCP